MEVTKGFYDAAKEYGRSRVFAFTSLAAAILAASGFDQRTSEGILTAAGTGTVLGVPTFPALDTGFDAGGVPLLYLPDREVRFSEQGLIEFAGFSTLPAPLSVLRSPAISQATREAFWRDLVADVSQNAPTKLQLLDETTAIHSVSTHYPLPPLAEFLQLAADVCELLPDWSPAPLWDKDENGENKVSVFYSGSRVYVFIVRDVATHSYVTRAADGSLTETGVVPWLSLSFGVGEPITFNSGTLTYVCGNLGSDATANVGIRITHKPSMLPEWHLLRKRIFDGAVQASRVADERLCDVARRLETAYSITPQIAGLSAGLTKIGVGKRHAELLLADRGYAPTVGDVYHRLTDTGRSGGAGAFGGIDIRNDVETARRSGQWLDLWVPRTGPITIETVAA